MNQDLQAMLDAYVVEMKWPDHESRRFRYTSPDGQWGYASAREDAIAILWRQVEHQHAILKKQNGKIPVFD